MKQTIIKIYCTASTPRLEYIAGFLTGSMGIHFKVIPHQSSSPPKDTGECRIHYDQQVVDGAFNIYSGGLMHETGIRTLNPEVVREDKLIMLFPAPVDFNLPFDIFSAVFYLISRYEEYTPHIPDQYGRFEATQSHAWRNNYLGEPVVDQWLLILQATLLKKYPSLSFPEKKFQFESTFDIDSPWAYKNKGLLRNLAGMAVKALQLNFTEVVHRAGVLAGKIRDPFDTYPYIMKMEDLYGFRSVFFFLLGNYGQFDVNYALNTSEFSDLMRTLNSDRTIGIHPSFKSNSNFKLLKNELERFEAILGKSTEISRQHYLIVSLPETYKRMASLGITSDYSMGYASMPGFRAGTSLSFKFFDVAEDKEYPLMIHPFVVMDVTLKQYLHLKPDDAIAQIKVLIRQIKDVHGVFTFLWHNESLSEYGIWKGWRKVFEDMVELASQ